MMLNLFLTAVLAAVNPFGGAEWIGAPWDSEVQDKTVTQPAPEFRKEIEISSKVRSATAYVTGLGFFEFFINGTKVGDEVLSPNETSYSQRGERIRTEALRRSGSMTLDDTHWRGYRVLYRTFDVTSMLHKGANTLGAILGNGFYSTETTRWTASYGTPRFLCRIDMELADGSRMSVVSGEDWSVRKSPVVLNDMYMGEIYDARESDGDWTGAVVRKAPGGRLLPQDGPADRVVETLAPKSIVKLDNGDYEVDFGDYVTGWVRLKDFQLKAGESVELQFPIETPGNGVYKYVSDGSYVKEYAPRFTWWVFRKAVVKGWPGELKPRNLIAEVVHSDVPVTGRFKCSNELFNRINDIWVRTQTDNMHLGVATDCPHREKGPYTGDCVAAVVTTLHNLGVKDFYKKWLHDMSDCQDTLTGYVPNGAPWHPGCGGGVAWGAAMNIVPWEHYLHYGDIEVLKENFQAMKDHMRFMDSFRMDDGTMLSRLVDESGNPIYYLNLGEWCSPYSIASENLVHTWFLWNCADYTAKAAKALGMDDDYRYYSAYAEDVASAFHKKFYNPVTGSYGAGVGTESPAGDNYGTGSGGGVGDGSNIFALAMGVPQDRYDKVVAAVKNELKANGGHLNTGIFGTKLFFEILCDNGMAEEAFEAMNKRDFPGYGWWVEQGADTFWESWDGKYSRNHPMMGGGLVWLYRKLAGLDVLEPGYRRILFRPTPVGDITWASYSTETSGGEASIYWRRDKRGNLVVKTRVPAGSTAVLQMPDGTEYELATGKSKHKMSSK